MRLILGELASLKAPHWGFIRRSLICTRWQIVPTAILYVLETKILPPVFKNGKRRSKTCTYVCMVSGKPSRTLRQDTEYISLHLLSRSWDKKRYPNCSFHCPRQNGSLSKLPIRENKGSDYGRPGESCVEFMIAIPVVGSLVFEFHNQVLSNRPIQFKAIH